MAIELPDDKPLVAPGEAAKPEDSMRLIAQGGTAVTNAVKVTGKEKFEFMVLYCLRLLNQAPKGEICGFYQTDFDDCDEHTMRVIQKLIGRSGFICSDFIDPNTKKYNGFWAWRKKDPAAAAPAPAAGNPPPQSPPQPPKIREF